MGTASPLISANLLHKDVTHAVSSVLNEEKEKSKRKLNLILHNIPESSVDNVDTRKQHDTDTAIAIINQHLAPISNVVRLGKRTEDHNYLGSDQTKAKILRNCTKIHNIKDPEYLQQVYITPDLTLRKEKKIDCSDLSLQK